MDEIRGAKCSLGIPRLYFSSLYLFFDFVCWTKLLLPQMLLFHESLTRMARIITYPAVRPLFFRQCNPFGHWLLKYFVSVSVFVRHSSQMIHFTHHRLLDPFVEEVFYLSTTHTLVRRHNRLLILINELTLLLWHDWEERVSDRVNKFLAEYFNDDPEENGCKDI